jgi:hypothetical protein
METGIFDLYAHYGVDYSVNFEYWDESDEQIDLEEGSLSFYVKKSVLPYDTFFEIHSDGSIIEGALPFPESESGYGSISFNDKVATLNITAVTMDQLLPTNYFYTLIRRVSNN